MRAAQQRGNGSLYKTPAWGVRWSDSCLGNRVSRRRRAADWGLERLGTGGEMVDGDDGPEVSGDVSPKKARPGR